MKTTSIYISTLMLLLVFTTLSYSTVVLEPIATIAHEAPTHPRTDFFFARGSDIQFDDGQPDILNIYTRFMIEEPGQEGVQFYPDFENQSQVERINIHTLVSSVEMQPEYATAGYLESTTFSVTVNDLMFTLESAYLETNSRDITNSWSDTRTLVRAKLSPNGALIAGELNHYRVSVPISGGGAHLRIMDFMAPGLWDAQTGALLYPEKFYEIFSSWRTDYSFEIEFSEYSGFFWIRGFDRKVFMFDLNQWETVTADRDVCFTSNNQQFITSRNDENCLVDAKNDVVLAQYQTPSPMVSATFSPDNSNVYILCEDDVVYVFDQELITTISGWELY